MRTYLALITLATIGLASCSQQRKEHAERKAGKAAYHVVQGAKKAAVKAGHEIKVASKQAAEGWKEAKEDRKSKQR